MLSGFMADVIVTLLSDIFYWLGGMDDFKK
jgi:hypothetical protein